MNCVNENSCDDYFYITTQQSDSVPNKSCDKV